MIRSFADRGTADVWDGLDSKAARRVCPAPLWPRARRKLDDLNQVRHFGELRTPPSNRLHRLRRDREDHAFDVEITDYH